MGLVTPVKCPKCEKVHSVTLLESYKSRLDLASGWFVLECPACQEKIDLETAKNMIAVKQEQTDVWF